MTGIRPEDSPPASPSPWPGANHNMSVVRKISGPLSPVSNGSSIAPATSPLQNGGDRSPSTPWGPPVSLGATGKSGKFIERLQSENASLRREYNVEKSAKEEAQKSLSTSKAIEEKYRAENERLEILHTTNTQAIERKNRKIEELKAALDAEVERRHRAEAREQMMAHELDNTHAEKNQAVGEAHNREQREKANADALRDGLQRMNNRYERQVQNITQDLGGLNTREQENRRRIMALEVSTDQSRREMRNSDEIVKRMGGLLERYKGEHEGMVDRLQEQAREFKNATHERVESGERLVQEMADTRDKMKWTMNIDRMQKNGDLDLKSSSKGKTRK